MFEGVFLLLKGRRKVVSCHRRNQSQTCFSKEISDVILAAMVLVPNFYW